MTPIRITQPASEPVDLSEIRPYARIDDDFRLDDDLIEGLIAGAREYGEGVTGTTFISSQWLRTSNSFPAPSIQLAPFGVEFSMPPHAIVLEMGPVISVDSVKYLDMAGVLQTMSSADYTVVNYGLFSMITPVFGKIWPIPLPQIGAVQVRYTAGYGTSAADVPATIRNWIKLRVSTLLENRESVALMQRGKIEPLPYADRLLDMVTSPLRGPLSGSR